MQASHFLYVVLLLAVVSAAQPSKGISLRREPSTPFDICGTWNVCLRSSSTSSYTYTFTGKKGEFTDTVSQTIISYNGSTCDESNISDYIRYELAIDGVTSEPYSEGEITGVWRVQAHVTNIFIRILDTNGVTCEGIDIDPSKEYNVKELHCVNSKQESLFDDYRETINDAVEFPFDLYHDDTRMWFEYSPVADTEYRYVNSDACKKSNVGLIVGIVVAVVVVIIIVVVIIVVCMKKEPETKMPASSASDLEKKKAEAKAKTESSAVAPTAVVTESTASEAAEPAPEPSAPTPEPEPAPAPEPAPVSTPEPEPAPQPTIEPAPQPSAEPAPGASDSSSML